MGSCAAIKKRIRERKQELSKKELKILLKEHEIIINNLENEKKEIIIDKNKLIEELETKNNTLQEQIIILENQVIQLSQKLKYNDFQRNIRIKFSLMNGSEYFINAKMYSKLYDDVFIQIISELDTSKDLDNLQFMYNGGVITKHFKNNDPVISLNPNEDEIAILIADVNKL